jgi:CheY-like chemotaxis protein
MSAGILVVAAQRDLRRNVFDALDGTGHPTIHTARGVPHAELLLDGRPPLALVVVAFDGDAIDAQASCEQLRRIPACAQAPMIAVLADGATVKPAELPGGISDWLYASQVALELVVRWRRARPPAALPAQAGPDQYRFAFEEDASEWFVVDPQTERVLETSSAVARHSHLEIEQLVGQGLRELLAFEGIAIEHVLQQADRRWYACQRRSSRGADTGQASARRIRHGGREAIALMFRSDRADVRAEAALSLLSRMFASASGIDTQKVAARLLVDELGLDYLALWSARPEGSASSPNLLIQLWRGDDQPWPAPAQQSALRQVLEGKTVLHPADARRLAGGDPLVELLGVSGFAGLPLFDERRAVLGALLVASRTPLGDMGLVEPVLRCAAARFAHAQAVLQHRVCFGERSQHLPQMPPRVAMQRLGHVRVGVHAQLRRRRWMAGVRIDEAVGQFQFQRVRVALLHVHVHVQPVVHAGTVAPGRERLRREQVREPVVVLRIQAHQELEASRKQGGSVVQYCTHRLYRYLKTWCARYRNARRSCWRSPRSKHGWY